MTPLEEATNNQRIAADPARSAFVLANAGSGKTRVLTDRVARLLLARVKPQQILCITFTKAAAAEMSGRLFDVLGKWALASDAELVAALKIVEGEGAPPKSPQDLDEARRLFARALETPGGLKIQTIHSFCESVLRRFPIEAGAPPGFSVIEDADAAAVMNAAVDAVAVDSANDETLAAAFVRLSLRRNESDLRALIRGAASSAPAIDALDMARAALAAELGVDPQTSDSETKAAFLGGLSDVDLRRAYEALAADGKAPQALAEKLLPYFTAKTVDEKWRVLSTVLLVEEGAKTRANIASKATDKIDPWVRGFVDELKENVFAATLTLRAIASFADTMALLRIGAVVRARYEAAKAARAALDFDDLIARANGLFREQENAWVMYKLDHGVDHILIDEAQDTSPGQWLVVESLFADFLSGAGARAVSRSFFAVGDLKQSIYSFQGADAGLFKQKETDLGAQLAQVTRFESVPLDMSFRTTEPVLTFVDETFNDRDACEGLGDYPMRAHVVKRDGAAGLVELWPLTPNPETPEVQPWDLPLDAVSDDKPARVLCERVAQTISGWLSSGEKLVAKNRNVRAGDILILVQNRDALFNGVIQRLAIAGVAVAGPDRLKLLEDPAVEDLISYARFSVTPHDDLSLAEILMSPLFGFDDDADLFALGYGRDGKESLWSSLRRRAGEKSHWKAAVEALAVARRIARREGPYAFFSHVLEAGALSGRRRFHDRMGGASDGAIDELLRQTLDYENGAPRSLRAFLAWFEMAAGDVKREPDRDVDAVRVMTVHGAKGLEAEIVFLLDAHRGVSARKIGPLLKADDAAAPPLLSWSQKEDAPAAALRRAEKLRLQYEEYRRLFYVAATRARDRLYICGVESGKSGDPAAKPVGEKTWHALADDAFMRLGARVSHGDEPFWPNGDAPVRRIECAQTAAFEPDNDERTIAPAAAEPAWLRAAAAQEAATARLAPSRLAGEGDSAPTRGESAAYSPLLGRDRFFRGRTLHRLLELLPDVDAEKRAAAADRLLARLAPDIPGEERARWRDEALAVLADPAFAAVFAPGSIAEAPIAGLVNGAMLTGQIDRLAVTENRVLVVDYKTNRPPPARAEDTDPAYVAQLAAYRALLQEIYPGRQVSCALLWTFDARLMDIPAEILDHAFARSLGAG